MLARVLAVVGDVSVAESGEAEASRVRAAMRARGFASTTINQTMNVFGMLLKRCHVLRLRPTARRAELEKSRERQQVVAKAYDDATFEALVAAAGRAGTGVHRAVPRLRRGGRCGSASSSASTFATWISSVARCASSGR
jgi:hypothetical protein